MAWLWAVAWSLQETPNHWVERLRSDDAEVREEATRRLKELGAEAIEALRAAAGDADPEVASRAQLLLRIVEIRVRLPEAVRRALPEIEERMAAGDSHAWTLAFIATDEAGCELASELMSPEDLAWIAPEAIRGISNEDEDRRVCGIVASYMIRSSAPDLVPLLHGNPEYDSRAVSALLHLGEAAVLPDLVRGLEKGGYEFIEGASDVLAAFGSKAGVEPLLRRLDDPEVRGIAADALLKLGAAEALAARLDHPDADTREAVWEAFADADIELPEADVRKRLRDADAGVRASAAWLLGRSGAVDSTPDLIACLDDPSTSVRHWALEAIGMVGGAADFAAVVPSLDDPEPSIRTIAARTLAALDGARARAPLAARLKVEADGNAREALVWTMAKVRAPEAVSELLKKFEEERKEGHVGTVVARAMAAYGIPETLDPLVSVLDDEIHWERPEVSRLVLAEARYRPAVDHLVANLAGDDPELRDRALESFTWVHGHDGAGPLAALLRSDRVETLRAAMDAYGRIGVRPPAANLMRLIDHGDAEVRAGAAASLGGVDSPEAIRALRARLADSDATVRRAVVESLADRGVHDAIASIGDPDEEVRIAAVTAAGRLGAASAAPDLRRLLSDDSDDVREAAARALLKLGETGAVVEYLHVHDDDLWTVRDDLGEALREEEVAAVEELLESDDAGRRAVAADVLGSAGYKRVVPALVRHLGDSEGVVREEVARALGLLDDPSAVPALIGRLEDPDGDVRSAAVVALANLGAREAVPTIRRRLYDWDSDVRDDATDALGILGAPVESCEPLPRLLRILRDPHADFRSNAVYALAEIDDPRARAALERATRDEDTWVRIGACRAIGSREAIAILSAALDDANPRVRVVAVYALGALGETGLLEAALEDEASPVRRAAAEFVERTAAVRRWAASDDPARRLDAAALAGPDAELLRELLSDADPSVVLEAARNLCLLGDDAGVGALLDRATDLRPLNAVRRPDEWRRLSRSAEVKLTSLQVRDRFEELWKLRLEPPRAADGSERVWVDPFWEATVRDWTAVEWLDEHLDGRFEFIVESDRIRIVTHEEAKRFWSAWNR